jgi:hypothetical protein
MVRYKYHNKIIESKIQIPRPITGGDCGRQFADQPVDDHFCDGHPMELVCKDREKYGP